MVRAEDVLDFCQTIYGTEVDTRTGAVNLFALEGCNQDLTQNADAPDQWNDTIAIIQFTEGKPTFTHLAQATCEPGLASTMSKQAARLGGVARIAIGWHKEKWGLGWHHRNTHHPALVQIAPITVHRDRNRDGKRTGDPITVDVQGLNWHSTRPTLKPVRVGGFSAGCIVCRDWNTHIDFIVKCRAMQLMYGDTLFSGTVVDWSRFVKWLNDRKT